ncbi:MAG TPA: cadherin repeat domain-containing protein [Bacteroides sp.]|nr:cadherin repeat domain-containing protein [Bacteroides sp.]
MSASLNSWTAPDPGTGDLFYRIAVEKPDPCVPEGDGKKAGTGPYQHSLSNMDDNKLKAGENPPDSIMLDNHYVDENRLPGNLVGRLTSRDLDTVDYHTYHLVSGERDHDNGSFSLIGDLLIAVVTFDYETKNTYNVRIKSTDLGNNHIENVFIINILDIEEPAGKENYTGYVL